MCDAGLAIGELARRYGLSRSTLLYYDRIGVLRPSGRSAAGYRRYSAADDGRLARICRYRRAGLPLATIRTLLDAAEADLCEAMVARLGAIERELQELRGQRQLILVYLGGDPRLQELPFLTVDRFVELLEAAGVGPEQRARWHAAFERTSGDAHQAFLEYLQIPRDGIERIRARAARRP